MKNEALFSFVKDGSCRQQGIISLFVVCLSSLIAVSLAVFTWDIQFWPTDARAFYFDAAVKLPYMRHVSDMHSLVDEVKIKWLHGKEIFIVAVSLMQRLMKDTATLRPFMMVNIGAVWLSSLLIFAVGRRLWGQTVAFVVYVAFTFCLWPYIYILFAKHQPLGLMFFLVAVALLTLPERRLERQAGILLSGVSFGLALFSSNVSPLYVPFFIAVLGREIWRDAGSAGRKVLIRQAFSRWAVVLLGVALVFLYVNWPNVLYNLRSYEEYVRISGARNHFFYNQAFLQGFFGPIDVATVRGGWLWIWRYLGVIMPFLFPAALLSAFFLVGRCLFVNRKRCLELIVVVAVSVAPLLMAEIARVAQYGANYFPSLISALLLIGYGLSEAAGLLKGRSRKLRMVLFTATGIWLLSHAVWNIRNFCEDVYPCRMVTTFLSRKIDELGEREIYIHKRHPQHPMFAENLIPEVRRKVKLYPLDYIVQPKQGLILIPPITGDSLYIAAMSTYGDFYRDVFLNELIDRKSLPKYAVASFKSLASSRFWLHEEEIFSYRKLILGHELPRDDLVTRVWLLDAEKIARQARYFIPRPGFLEHHQENWRDIGRRTGMYRYEGFTAKILEPKTLSTALVRLYKTGNPRDSLIAYVYELDKEQEVWVRLPGRFYSDPLPASQVLSDKEEGVGAFNFRPPISLKQGNYFFIIFRTGPPDDDNYFTILKDYWGII